MFSLCTPPNLGRLALDGFNFLSIEQRVTKDASHTLFLRWGWITLTVSPLLPASHLPVHGRGDGRKFETTTEPSDKLKKIVVAWDEHLLVRHGALRTAHPTCQLEAEQHVIVRPPASCERSFNTTPRTSAAPVHASPQISLTSSFMINPGHCGSLLKTQGEKHFYFNIPPLRVCFWEARQRDRSYHLI